LLAYLAVDRLVLNDLDGVDARPTESGQVLTWNGEQWVAAAPAAGGGVTDHGALGGLPDDDHEQYLRTDGTRALTGDLDAGEHKITNLASATRAGEAMSRGQAASGDLSGRYPNPRIARLRGRPISTDEPQEGNVLTWDGGQWSPMPGGATTETLLPFATITHIGGLEFEIWFNIDAPENEAAIAEEFPLIDALEVWGETDTELLAPIGVEAVKRIGRNRYSASLFFEGDEYFLLRFRFSMQSIPLATEESLYDYAMKGGIRFMGQDVLMETVTKFVYVQV
jgi:hypothetical protein